MCVRARLLLSSPDVRRIIHGLLCDESGAGIAVPIHNVRPIPVHRLTLPRDHHLNLPFRRLGLILVCVFQQLETVANLGLVEAVGAIGGLSSSCDRLLRGPSGRLVR